MQYFLIVTSLFTYCTLASAFAQKAPYGMVKVGENLFVDDTEITNNEYRQFLQENPTLTDIKPDSNIWNGVGDFENPLSEFYYSHPAFDDYPVVGITYEQALKFCEWRTQLQNEYARSRETRGKKAIFYLFRLPTEAEWEEIATNLNPNAKYAGGWETPKNKKGEYHFNFVAQTDTAKDYLVDNFAYTNSVKEKIFISYQNKIYGLAGNVSEVVEEKGIAKGGSWNSPKENCTIKVRESYEGATAWIGFRCVAEIYQP